MSSRTLFTMILCVILFSVGVSYYYYYKSNFAIDAMPIHRGESGELINDIERDIIMTIKNDISDKKGAEITIKAQIEQIVKDTIQKNPEILVDTLSKYYRDQQLKQNKKSESKVKELIKKLEDGSVNPVYGSDNPTIKVVEFFDYSCGYCKKMFYVNKRVIEKHSDVQFIFREFPMYPASKEASRAALVVNMIDPKKYIVFQEKMFEFTGEKTKDNVEKVVVDLGIDSALFKKTLENKETEIQKIWDENKELMEKIGVNSTPTLIVWGKLIPGFIDFKALDKLVTEGNNIIDPSTVQKTNDVKKDNKKS